MRVEIEGGKEGRVVERGKGWVRKELQVERIGSYPNIGVEIGGGRKRGEE